MGKVLMWVNCFFTFSSASKRITPPQIYCAINGQLELAELQVVECSGAGKRDSNVEFRLVSR